MILSRIESIYNWIDKLNPNLKTILIVLLFGGLMYSNYKSDMQDILKDYGRQVQDDKALSEQYTKDKSSEINAKIENILVKDGQVNNVLLLNYHNTLTSTHGLSYRYLTVLTEKKRGGRSCLRYWKELEYVHYGEEIEKINELKYLRIDTLSKSEEQFPNLVELIKMSGHTSAAVYPIRGHGDYVGMVVMLYKKHRSYDLGYYQEVLSESVQDLAILLDYNLVKEQYRKEHESR